jgi:RHS repeat-associated protein
LLETNVSDATQVVYSQEPAAYGNLISQYRGGSTNFFHFDGLGSTDRLSNNTPAVTDSFIYEAFGKVRSSSGSTSNNFKYVGKLGYYWDSDLALYLLRARYYDPATGRFLSRDPVSLPAERTDFHQFGAILNVPFGDNSWLPSMHFRGGQFTEQFVYP